MEPTFPICETSYSKNEEFFLFSTIFEASMFDKKLHDKQVYFELSMGNAGNSLDGHNESHTIITGEEEELDAIDVTTFNSTTSSCKPISHDRSHYFLPYWDYKQCMDVRCSFPDLRRRMYNSNMIAKICERFEEGLQETHQALEREDPISEVIADCLPNPIHSCMTLCIISCPFPWILFSYHPVTRSPAGLLALFPAPLLLSDLPE